MHPQNTNLDAFIEEEFWPAKEGLSFTTLRGYRGDVRRVISPALGHMPILAIGHREVQQMLNSAPTRKAAKAAKGTLSSILSLAVDYGLLGSNPVIGRYTLPRSEGSEASAFAQGPSDWAEINCVLDSAREYDAGGEIERICLAGLGFGLRKGEILGLDMEDFDLSSGILSVRRNYTRWYDGAAIHDLKTKESKRDIPVPDFIGRRLRQLKLTPGAFVTYQGHRSHPSTASKHFAKFREEYGLKGLTIASMRHSFATAALHSGVDVKNVQAWLGHTDAATTLRNYCHSSIDELKKAKDQIDASIDGLTAENRAVNQIMSQKASENEAEQIVEKLLWNPELSQKQLADALGMSLSTVKRRMADLEKREAIMRVGGRKTGKWAVFPSNLNRYELAA